MKKWSEIKKAKAPMAVLTHGIACVMGVGGRRGRRRQRALAHKGYVNHVALEIAARKDHKAREAEAMSRAQLDMLNKHYGSKEPAKAPVTPAKAAPAKAATPAKTAAKPKAR